MNIEKIQLIESVKYKGRFIYLLNQSSLKPTQYQEIFGEILVQNPKYTMLKALLNHPIGAKTSFNKHFNGKHLLELMVEKDLQEMFNITLKKTYKELNKQDVENISLTIINKNNLKLWHQNKHIFNTLIKKYKINIINVFLKSNFNFEFISYALKSNSNIHIKEKGQHSIFNIFKKEDISSLNKIKLFYLYKDRQINILEKDPKSKSIIHYLIDFNIKEGFLKKLLNQIPKDIRVNYIIESELFNYILTSKKNYNKVIMSNLQKEHIKFLTQKIPLQLLAIKKENEILVDFLLDEGYLTTEIVDFNNQGVVNYAILTNNITYLEKIVKLGMNITNENVSLAKNNNMDNKIVLFLEERNSILYKVTRYFNIILHNTLYLSISIFLLLLLLSFLLLYIRYTHFSKLILGEETKKRKLTKSEKNLEKLRNKINNIDKEKVGKKVDVKTIELLEDEFGTKTKTKTKHIINSRIKEEQKREQRKITQNEIKKQLEALPDSDDFDISDSLLAELEEDFKNSRPKKK